MVQIFLKALRTDSPLTFALEFGLRVVGAVLVGGSHHVEPVVLGVRPQDVERHVAEVVRRLEAGSDPQGLPVLEPLHLQHKAQVQTFRGNSLIESELLGHDGDKNACV